MIVYVYKLIDTGTEYKFMTAKINAEERKQSYRLGDADPKRSLVGWAKILHKRDELLVCGDLGDGMYVFSKEDKPDEARREIKEDLCRRKEWYDEKSKWMQEMIDCVTSEPSKDKPTSNAYERFAKLLQERNVKAAHVSKATGIATATLTEWKNGKYVPKVDKLRLIAKFFGVPIEYFYGDC